MKKREQILLIGVIGFLIGLFGSYNILSESEFFKSISSVFIILGFVGFVIALWIIVRYYRSEDN